MQDTRTWMQIIKWEILFLGVTISADMKVSEQCGIAASMPMSNHIVGLIRRNITYKVKEKRLIIPLYKAIVRPHLEHCKQAWRPYCKKDIDMLERIQSNQNDSRTERP